VAGESGNPGALGGAGFLGFANVFGPSANPPPLYSYGVFPAPNGTPGFSSVATGQGGVPQGSQQLVTYSDYNNPDHAVGNRIETNVFQEQIIGVPDFNKTYTFSFDAKKGDITGSSTALAFIKTLDPANGYFMTNFVTVDTTNLASVWNTYALNLLVTPSLNGQILQFGFLTNATNYEASGVFYDNLNFAAVPVPAAVWLFGSALGVLGAARRKSIA